MLTLKKLVLNCSCIFVHFPITVNYVNLSLSVRLRTAIQEIFNKSKSILAFGRAKIAKIQMKNLALKRRTYFPPNHATIHICPTDLPRKHSCSSWTDNMDERSSCQHESGNVVHFQDWCVKSET